ncbi:MAG: DUF4159 domain-containing protein [Lentisphaeria bacterium]|nr:DUF4159 domain-containing protein [Lentisphaeria bacterium]NQZ66472.1 DUF4159 domain-containing protein [Lentisphaeria bacterium]
MKLFIAVLALLISTSLRAGSFVDQAKKGSSSALNENEINKRKSKKEERDGRNKLSMRRIKPTSGSSDWNTDPTAIPFMLYQVKERTGLPIYINNDGLDVGSDDIFEESIIYLTSHHAWAFNEKESNNLQIWLKRGGTLLLDDCYNKGSSFSDSVQPEVGKMIPGASGTILLKTDHIVSDVFKMVYDTDWPGESLEAMRPWQYFMLDDRPAVFFTPNDDGCGWEISTPPSASNPLGEGIGHGGDNRARERFYMWATNWMMYVYCH